MNPSVPVFSGHRPEIYECPTCDTSSTAIALKGGHQHVSLYTRQLRIERPSEHSGIFSIQFTVTSPDETTVAISQDYEEETTLLYTADTKFAHNLMEVDAPGDSEYLDLQCQLLSATPCDGNEKGKRVRGWSEPCIHEDNIIELDTLTVEDLSPPDEERSLLVSYHDNEEYILFDDHEEQLEHLLDDMNSSSRGSHIAEESAANDYEQTWDDFESGFQEHEYLSTEEVVSMNGTKYRVIDWRAMNARAHCSIGFYPEDSDPLDPPNPFTQEEIPNHLTLMSCPPSSDHDITDDDSTDENDIAIPLSRFQPLPIGPFAPEPTTSITQSSLPPIPHYHLSPKISLDIVSRTVTITHAVDAHWDCSTFQLARAVADISGVPLPLHRRVHELQGCIQVDRRGLSEWLAWREGSRQMSRRTALMEMGESASEKNQERGEVQDGVKGHLGRGHTLRGLRRWSI